MTTVDLSACYYFQWNPFSKVIILPITPIPANTTMLNNVGDTNMADMIADTEQKCLDKITELQLTYPQ